MIREILKEQFYTWAGEMPQSINLLPQSGSNRQYFRLKGDSKSAIGAYSPDARENKAFVAFSKEFHNAGLAVPEVYVFDEESFCYLQEDLGDTTLFALRSKNMSRIEDNVKEIYFQSVNELAAFQVKGGEKIDFQLAYPREAFDEQSMRWDLNYCKYYFLKLAGVSFDEQYLENDFSKLIEYLLQAPSDYFLFRDFQSRNIMVRDGKAVFIDYQGGRKGALQYDLASLLYDAKADLSDEFRNELKQQYLSALSEHISVDERAFEEYFQAFVLIRIMQALGAYGFRGFYEQKSHFLKSIPFALHNLRTLLAKWQAPIELPHLFEVLGKLEEAPRIKQIISEWSDSLRLEINSFSYKRGIPSDLSGNGGGFVFDCRALPNPGREVKYKKLTGKDSLVIQYFDAYKEDMNDFMDSCFNLVNRSVLEYKKRGFSNLMVSFGCTGGQHRSVFCAEDMFRRFSQTKGLSVVLNHREQGDPYG